MRLRSFLQEACLMAPCRFAIAGCHVLLLISMEHINAVLGLNAQTGPISVMIPIGHRCLSLLMAYSRTYEDRMGDQVCFLYCILNGLIFLL